MGNTNTKKTQKEPDRFFERERWKEQRHEEKRKRKANQGNKRSAITDAPVTQHAMLSAASSSGSQNQPKPAPPGLVRSYDAEAVERMRFQLHNDADAFLLNNILLSVQFFENYEREVRQIKNNPMNDQEHEIDTAMVNHHKHVFFADHMLKSAQEHVSYQRTKRQQEPLSNQRIFVIYDNVEASEPGDTSDYSAVLDAPFYKLRIEDCNEPGYVKLKKLEVLESTLTKKLDVVIDEGADSDDSIYPYSEDDSNGSENELFSSKGEALLQKIKSKLDHSLVKNQINVDSKISQNSSTHGSINSLSNREEIMKDVLTPHIENIDEFSQELNKTKVEQFEKPRKSILKNARRLSGPSREMKNQSFAGKEIIRKASSESNITETTSGYRSNSSSRYYESSEAESDYGYCTITESATPKKVELSLHSDYIQGSGVLVEQCWAPVKVQNIDSWSDDEDDTASKLSFSKPLYETNYYLNSVFFMVNFVDSFMLNLGPALGFNQDIVKNALTQGASIYCDTTRNNIKLQQEVFPALLAAWPSAANQWIIRERRIIQNPRTNFTYQWPTKYMVSKVTGFGCLLVPIGFRPKRGSNPVQMLQWKIVFPAAERYLESCLAHSHMRCYLFSILLQKTFLEVESSKIGIDSSHWKNHLFWQCEDNYAMWPEDRLGETLRLFIRRFYTHLCHGRFPNYFMENCNEFKSIPKPVLLKIQRRLADILEAPVTHLLHSISMLKYNKSEFYPKFNSQKLYEILTCKNPLRLINPNIPSMIPMKQTNSDSDEDNLDFWERAKIHDKHYQWKKEKQRLCKQERRKPSSKKQRHSKVQETEIEKKIILPTKLDPERRRLVLELFIPHFIAMARSSEKFEAVKQAVIYLEQAQRLCTLLEEEPAGETTANEYLHVIRDKLVDCQRKMVNQGDYKIHRRDSRKERPMLKMRPKYEHIVNQSSPTDRHHSFTFVDVHSEFAKKNENINLNNDSEESKL